MKRSEITLMVLQVPIDFFMLLLAAVSAYALRFSPWAQDLRPILFSLTPVEFLSIAVWVAVGWMFIFVFTGLYSTNPNRKFAQDMLRVFTGCTIGLAAIAVYILFTQDLFDSRFLVLAGWGFAILYVTLGRLYMRGVKAILYRAGVGLRRVAVIGNGELVEAITKTLSERRELGYKVVAQEKNFTASTRKRLEHESLDEIIFTNPRANEREALAAIKFCNERHITFKYSADLFATYSSNMSVSPLAGVPIIELKKTPLEGWGRVTKRIFDIIASLFFIVLLSPFIILSSLIILIETGRPIIYKNERVGIRGILFNTLKFRSMYQKDSTGSQFGDAGREAEEREKTLIKKQSVRNGPIYKIADDPRVTPFGTFIRRWSIDELPQFWNVLRGDMSIVGPRPHQPREVVAYEKEYPHVFTLKPGITGLAQISGRSDLSFEEEMALDVFYIEKWSLYLDLIIVVKTPFVLFRKRKAL